MDLNTFFKQGYEIKEEVQAYATFSYSEGYGYTSAEDLTSHEGVNEGFEFYDEPSKYTIYKNGSVIKSDLLQTDLDDFINALENE